MPFWARSTSTFSAREGVLWLTGDRMATGKDIETAELRVRADGHRYRIKFQGWSTVSDDSPFLDLAGQVSKLARLS